MIPDLSKYEFFKDKEYELIPLKDGEICRTFCMVTNGTKYLVRINDDFSPRSVKREVDTISYVKSYGGGSIMPRLYYYDEEYNVCVTEYYDGFIDLTKYNASEEDYALISNYLQQIIKTMQEIENPSEVSIYELAKKYINLNRYIDNNKKRGYIYIDLLIGLIEGKKNKYSSYDGFYLKEIVPFFNELNKTY